MKNIIIGVIVALAIFGGLWYVLGQKSNDSPNSSHSSEETVNCPVMGTAIKPSKAYAKTEYKGKTYYFCCAMCPDKFKENPEKYIGKDKKK